MSGRRRLARSTRNRLAALSVFVAAFTGLVFPAAAADTPVVVTSIKPVNSLVAAVMQGVAKPYLIVKGAASPHTAALKPSDATALSQAAAVFWIGPEFENFLIKPISSLGSKADVVELWDAPNVQKLRNRSGGMFEAEVEQHAGGAKDADEAHGDNPYDKHVWLDPQNAAAMTQTIAATLAKVDPDHAVIYHKNADAYVQRLVALGADVRQLLSVKTRKPFIVFHDAYQYFEHRFDIPAVGSITISPEKAPGAARLREIRAKLQSLGAACVFTEPEFPPRLVETVTRGTNVSIGVMDPLGAALKDGPDLYPQLVRNIAVSLEDCFDGK
nr:zinc ABC transporter substrate-binding protein [Jiella flava]